MGPFFDANTEFHVRLESGPMLRCQVLLWQYE